MSTVAFGSWGEKINFLIRIYDTARNKNKTIQFGGSGAVWFFEVSHSHRGFSPVVAAGLDTKNRFNGFPVSLGESR